MTVGIQIEKVPNCIWRLTNALLEGTNSPICLIKNRAKGFYNPESTILICYLVSAREKIDVYGRSV